MRRLVRAWRSRVAVDGHSMEPTLRDGDWLLVDREAYRRRSPVVGDLVVAVDPRRADRLLVKRVARIDSEGRLLLAGDHPAHKQIDEVELPPVLHSALLGRPWWRYWPLRRVSRPR